MQRDSSRSFGREWTDPSGHATTGASALVRPSRDNDAAPASGVMSYQVNDTKFLNKNSRSRSDGEQPPSPTPFSHSPPDADSSARRGVNATSSSPPGGGTACGSRGTWAAGTVSTMVSPPRATAVTITG